jgi:hypothetical protein
MEEEMRDKIEKIIIDEVKYAISEIDIEGYLDKKRIKQLVQNELHDQIRDRIAKEIEMSIFKAIQKERPLIDAYVADKVNQIMRAVEKV